MDFCLGLHLSLQSQNLLYIQAFDETNRAEISSILEKEKWKRSEQDFSIVLEKLESVPILHEAFNSVKVDEEIIESKKNNDKEDEAIIEANEGSASPPDDNTDGDDQEDCNGIESSSPPTPINNNKDRMSKAAIGDIVVWKNDYKLLLNPQDSFIFVFQVDGEIFSVPDSAHDYIAMIGSYCELCSSLPSTSVELGLKTAELMKLYNSKICQLLIGAGAISVSGLKTITIRNLALAQRSVQLVLKISPYVRRHFEMCYQMKLSNMGMGRNPTAVVNGGDYSPSHGESKQLETFRKQFEQAGMHFKNHSEEVESKILYVTEDILSKKIKSWEPSSNQLPSQDFKLLCGSLTKLHGSVADIWSRETAAKVMLRVKKTRENVTNNT